MSVHKIRELATMLRNNHTPENHAYVADMLQGMGLSVADMYNRLEMEHKHVEAFREEGGCGPSTPVHSHRFAELIYCRSSIGCECIIGHERHALLQGDIMLVPPGVSHGVLMPPDPNRQKKHYVIWISMEFLEHLKEEFSFFARYPLEAGTLIHTSGTGWEQLELYFRRIVEEWETRSPGWEPAMVAGAVLLLSHLSRAVAAVPVVKSPQEKQDLLNQLLVYVEANLAEKITLEDTANHFWISTTTLSTLFSRRMGVSFYQYVLKRRLREARDQITQGMPIESAAAKVGFSDYSAFYRAFRREYGLSPRQYRRGYYAEKDTD